MQRDRHCAVAQSVLRAELAAARLQALQLQLNPHFLFNALNSIASLVHSDVKKADTAIRVLSSFLRASLSSTSGEETTLENELRLVDAYLHIESLRFEWLTVDLEVPDALRSARVPAFALQQGLIASRGGKPMPRYPTDRPADQRGRRRVNTVPSFSEEVTWIVPPCALTIRSAM
jgi:hypothetical protein